jgi:molybdenum cofactor cytidylyltransferase
VQINLVDAFDIRNKACTALVGAGGKTSALFRLGRAFDEPVFLANSAHLSMDQLKLAARVYTIHSPQDFPDFSGGISSGLSLFCGPELAGKARVSGLDPVSLAHLHQLAGYHAVPLLIEADGSRRLPLKAPAEHEPPIPAFADAVIVCAGLQGLGQLLSDESVFRAERFGALAGLQMGEPVSVEALANVLLNPLGGLKNIPPGALRGVLLNQAVSPSLRHQAAELARALLFGYANILTTELNGPGPVNDPVIHTLHRPAAGIILAAGASSRLGQPKQLLDWHGEPLVRRAARTALEGGLSPVVVVTGAHAVEVEAALDGLPICIARCDDWASGQSASLKAGLRAALRLRPTLGSAMFLLADQPFVGPDLVRAVTDLHARNAAPAAAPRVSERRANPVLFDRQLFPALLDLQGDSGGRHILANQPIATLDWPDPSILLDIDTQQDYQNLR